jgi:molybdopterin molybdotransferase
MTGAVVPKGGEAVIPVEDTDFVERQPGTPPPAAVKIYRPASLGENVRPSGQDVHAGEVVMPAGARLRPQDIGFLAMLGEAEVPVHRLPQVAVFSTGDELVPLGNPLAPGKIHDSNTYTLIALIEKYGGRFLNLGIVPDRAEAVQDRLERAVEEKVDLILSSAGVSVGAFDFVRNVVEQHGHLDFWRVNMRPGKPLAFGNYRGIPFVGLPGNPVSAFVGFEVFVRPAILKMMGLTRWERPVHRAELLESIESDGRESYLRGVVENRDGKWLARLTGHQGSGNLRSLVQANAILLIPSGVKSLPIGAGVDAWLLDQF